MTAELCLSALDLEKLRGSLLSSKEERCAILYATESRRSNGQLRLLVCGIEFPAPGDYLRQGLKEAELTPAFVAHIAKKAKLERLALVFVHTHPGEQAPLFSSIDDRGEDILDQFLDRRGVDRYHVALVMSAGGLRARRLGRDEEMRVISLGAKRVVEFDPNLDTIEYSEIFDRQVRAFGAAGQRRLERLRVAIVGLGGTGSIAAQQLVHLGVKQFILVDHDFVEETNLNRIVGATPSDIGKTKVEVAARYLEAFRIGVSADQIVSSVVHASTAHQLIDADIIFCCTDSHGSRSVIQQVAYQHLIPCIDVGSTITQMEGNITGIFGRVQLLSPSLPCLWCCELLDSTEVRRDMMSESERRLDPYIVGAHEPAPAVISLNGTVVSLGISMLLGIVAGVPVSGTHLIYNALKASIRSVRGTPQPNCFICSENGALAKGDSKPLLVRQD